MKQVIDQDANNTQVTFFIIPGFRQSVADDLYQWLVRYLSHKQINIVAVEIHWNYRTMRDYITEFQIIYQKNKTKVNYVLGFSYGAVIAVMTGQDLLVDRLLLCSLSPDFAEDRTAMSPEIVTYIGKKRYTEASSRLAQAIAKNLTVQTVLFCGEKESVLYPQMLIRAQEMVSSAQHAKLVMVENAPHDIGFLEYQREIIRELDQILR